MVDFRFLRVPGTKQWVISDPNRAKRPNVGRKIEEVCPFCVGRERQEEEVHREGGMPGDSNWHIRVIKNKFPFTFIHEIVVHSPDHHRNFEELPLSHIELILKTYRLRYEEHRKRGQVYIFHNRGIAGGESIPHPHSQITVIPHNIPLDIAPLDLGIYSKDQRSNIKDPADAKAMAGKQNHPPSLRLRRASNSKLKDINFGFLTSLFRGQGNSSIAGAGLQPGLERSGASYPPSLLLRRAGKLAPAVGSLSVARNDKKDEFIETESFLIFCPESSQWSDEVWIAPQRRNMHFGDINDQEITDLAFCLQRLINILDMRHGHEFAFNFYIYPGKNWYLRIIPRYKILGGFEVGTGIIVNTQDPRATFAFIKEHFFEPDLYKIRLAQQEDYWKSV